MDGQTERWKDRQTLSSTISLTLPTGRQAASLRPPLHLQRVFGDVFPHLGRLENVPPRSGLSNGLCNDGDEDKDDVDEG